MTTQESNKLIAEFMGHTLEYHSVTDEWSFDVSPENELDNRRASTDSLLYHISWDWLMPVVERIQMDWEGLPEVFFGHLDLGSPIEQVYDAVIECLKKSKSSELDI